MTFQLLEILWLGYLLFIFSLLCFLVNDLFLQYVICFYQHISKTASGKQATK